MIALWFARDYFVGLWAVLYLVLIVTLGLLTIRKGHLVLFICGIFLPFLWLIGALMPDRRLRREVRREERMAGV